MFKQCGVEFSCHWKFRAQNVPTVQQFVDVVRAAPMGSTAKVLHGDRWLVLDGTVPDSIGNSGQLQILAGTDDVGLSAQYSRTATATWCGMYLHDVMDAAAAEAFFERSLGQLAAYYAANLNSAALGLFGGLHSGHLHRGAEDMPMIFSSPGRALGGPFSLDLTRLAPPQVAWIQVFDTQYVHDAGFADGFFGAGLAADIEPLGTDRWRWRLTTDPTDPAIPEHRQRLKRAYELIPQIGYRDRRVS